MQVMTRLLDKRALAVAAVGWLIYAFGINPVWANIDLTFEQQVRHGMAHFAVGVFLLVVVFNAPGPKTEDSDAT